MTKIKQLKEGRVCLAHGLKGPAAWRQRKRGSRNVRRLFNFLSILFLLFPFFPSYLTQDPAREVVPPALRVSVVSPHFELSGNTFIFKVRAMSPR